MDKKALTKDWLIPCIGSLRYVCLNRNVISALHGMSGGVKCSTTLLYRILDHDIMYICIFIYFIENCPHISWYKEIPYEIHELWYPIYFYKHFYNGIRMV